MMVRNVRALKRGVEGDVTLWSVTDTGATSQVTLHVLVHPSQDPLVAAALEALQSALHANAQRALGAFASGQVPTP